MYVCSHSQIENVRSHFIAEVLKREDQLKDAEMRFKDSETKVISENPKIPCSIFLPQFLMIFVIFLHMLDWTE